MDTGSTQSAERTSSRICSFEDYAWRQGSVQMACSFRAGIENNLDWCHPAFAHPWTHPQWYATKLRGLSDVSHEVRGSPDGLVMFAPDSTAPDDPLPSRPAMLVTFTPPNRITVESWRPAHSIVMHFVPTGLASCRLDSMTTTALPPARRGRARSTWREPVAFRLDQLFLEGAQCNYEQDSNFERSVKADTSTLFARRVLDLAEAGEWPQRHGALPARAVIDVRA